MYLSLDKLMIIKLCIDSFKTSKKIFLFRFLVYKLPFKTVNEHVIQQLIQFFVNAADFGGIFE